MTSIIAHSQATRSGREANDGCLQVTRITIPKFCLPNRFLLYKIAMVLKHLLQRNRHQLW